MHKNVVCSQFMLVVGTYYS